MKKGIDVEPLEMGDFLEAFLVMFGRAVIALMATVVILGLMAARVIYKESKEFRKKPRQYPED